VSDHAQPLFFYSPGAAKSGSRERNGSKADVGDAQNAREAGLSTPTVSGALSYHSPRNRGAEQNRMTATTRIRALHALMGSRKVLQDGSWALDVPSSSNGRVRKRRLARPSNPKEGGTPIATAEEQRRIGDIQWGFDGEGLEDHLLLQDG